jgi:hypothetical protein
MKLRKQDQEFRNPRIFYADPKNVDLDRVLVVLFLWLKTGGMRPARQDAKRRSSRRSMFTSSGSQPSLASPASPRTKRSHASGLRRTCSTW